MPPVRQVEGLRELERNMRKFTFELQDKILKSALMAAGLPFVKDAKIRSRERRDSGDMEASISRRNARKTGDYDVLIQVYVKKKAFYWFWQEFGSDKLDGIGFMGKAFEAQKEAALSRAVEVLKKKVSDANR
jgi:HK97 gp10 family phage protein